MKQIILLVLFLGVIACQTQKKESQPMVEKLKGEQILQEYFEIENIFVVDSLLITKNHKSSSRLFSIFGKNHNLIMGFGQLGAGPLDFENEVYFNNQVYYNNNHDICIWLYEIHHHRLRLVNISKTIKNRTIVIEKEVDIKPNLNMENLFYIDSLLVVGNVNNMDVYMDKLRFYNPVSKKLEKTIPLSPKVKLGKNRNINWIQYEYNSLFVNKLSYQDRKGFVAGMVEMDRIDFMNSDGVILKTVSGNRLYEKSSVFSDFPKGNKKTVFYLDVVALKKNVYTLYNGKDTYENINLNNNVVKVYNWEGVLVKCFAPTEPLYKIAVDEIDNILYGVSEDDNKIYKYDLEDIYE